MTTAPTSADFIRTHTALGCHPMVPEVTLHLATEITPIWHATEDWLAERNIAPPFWAFAWPGGVALARHILDHPHLVAGRHVLDFAAGGGIAAIACAKAGAASVEAAEIDPLAAAAITLNAAVNGVAITATAGDVVGSANRWDLILCGDVCYEAPMTAHILPWLLDLTRGAAPDATTPDVPPGIVPPGIAPPGIAPTATRPDAEVWIADPGRTYLPRQGLEPFARTTVATTLELEDRLRRDVVLYRLR